MKSLTRFSALAALLLLTATVAEARQVSYDLAVIKLNSNKASGATNGVSDVEMGNWIHENVGTILTEWGVDYITINPASFTAAQRMNEQVRVGRFFIGPDTISVRAVLHERFSTRSASFDYPQYRPDSLTLARTTQKLGTATVTPCLPAVPQLLLMEPFGAYADLVVIWRLAATCSVGVTSSSIAINGGAGIPHECEACHYKPGAVPSFFPTTANVAGKLNLATTGGVLPLLSTYTNMIAAMQGDGYMPPFLADGWDANVTDTTGFHGNFLTPFRQASPDTASVWKRLNIGWNVLDADADTVAAAQIIAAACQGALGNDDLSATSRTEFEVSAFFVGLAALDSLLGGDLIQKHKTMAVTIDGAFARCNQQSSFGVYLPDSAAIKATVDSLVSYGIPFLVGANVDSVAAYPYERAWWDKGSAKFTPQVWSGVHGANGAASYVAGRYTLRDIFGHARARTATEGGASGDTSTYSQLRYAFARCDSLFPGRSSRFLLPPLDDYRPTNSAITDSILIAARLAGASGIRINGMDTLRTALQSTNVQGWFKGMKMLAHTGEYVTGGSRLIGNLGVHQGTTYFVEDSGYTYHPLCDINDKQLSGVVRGKWNSYYNGIGSAQFGSDASSVKPQTNEPYETNKFHNRYAMASRGSILKAAASTLGGDTYVASLSQPQGAPLRPGWWAIRSADGFRAVVNAVAGRTLIRWGYADQVEP